MVVVVKFKKLRRNFKIIKDIWKYFVVWSMIKIIRRYSFSIEYFDCFLFVEEVCVFLVFGIGLKLLRNGGVFEVVVFV